MEIIDLDSENTSFRSDAKEKHEVILYVQLIQFHNHPKYTNIRLTDESDPIVCTTNSATQRRPLPPSSPCYPKTSTDHIFNTSRTSFKPSQTDQNILDIESWLSSSDEDSIDLLSGIQPLKRSKKKIEVSSSAPEQLDRTPKPVQFGLPQKQNVEFKLPPKRVTHNMPAIVLDSEMSDPIDSSPRTSQVHAPPKPKSTQEESKESKFTKKEWVEANRATRKTEDIYREMIIEVADSLAEKIETDYFRECFKDANYRRNSSKVHLISWKRKVKALYYKEKDIFEPCEPREIFEKVKILFYEAEELVDKIQKGTLQADCDIARQEAKEQDSSLDSYIMIMVVGTKEYLRKLQGIEDRAYRDQMLIKMNEPLSKKRKHEEVVIKASEAQRCIHEAGISLELNIFSVRTMQEAVDWLYSFTYTIGNALYDKFQRNPSLANIGTVRLGSDRKSTYLEMVKKFNLMTQTRAEKLYEFYSTPVALYKRFLRAETLGTVNGKNIVPPTANAAMKRVFTATDPSQVIT